MRHHSFSTSTSTIAAIAAIAFLLTPLAGAAALESVAGLLPLTSPASQALPAASPMAQDNPAGEMGDDKSVKQDGKGGDKDDGDKSDGDKNDGDKSEGETESKRRPGDRPSKVERDAARVERDAAKAKAKWFDRLDREDKSAIEAVVGFAAPDLPADVELIGADFTKMADLRGKVVLIQTFTTKTSTGSASLRRSVDAAAKLKLDAKDLAILAIHTPEGIDKAKASIERLRTDRLKLDTAFALDAKGVLSDALGAFRKPIAYVVDRQGNVRYAGLSAEGIEGAIAECAAETFDEDVPAKTRESAEKKPADATVKFPTYDEPIRGARDLRGEEAPEYHVERWYNVNKAPDLTGKLVVVDFWATWCPPCIAAIPHMNEIASAYPEDVLCIGVSDESWRNFEEGTKKKNLSKSDFKYPVGTDPAARMKNGFGITAIPHVAVISSDGVVRWQGHPMSLNPQTMNELIASNRALRGAPGGGSAQAPNRWQRGGAKVR